MLQARYDRIRIGYDTTRRADPYLTSRLLHHLQPTMSGSFLDVACGSGNYMVAMQHAGLRMTGIDQSQRMIAEASMKSPAVRWIIGDADSLPFPDGSFDGALCTLAIHHFRNVSAALSEIRRVLRGGRLVILTASREQMRQYWLNSYFPAAMRKSIEQMPHIRQLEEAALRHGFCSVAYEPYEIQLDLIDFFLYSGKHNPAIYLDAAVRAGISTFSLLADSEEVAAGCHRLAADIASGEIERVMASYRHSAGDYLFVTLETK